MIQFNLLPDIKIQFNKTQRTKRTLLVISLLAAAISVGLLLILFSFLAVQKKHISDLDKDISSLQIELENEPDLSRILSIQNQLNKLPDLYDGRPAITRLPGYLDQITPVGTGMSSLNLDLSSSKMEITASAKSLELMYNHVDTIKYTEVVKKVEGQEDQKSFAFSSVVLTSFGKSETGATYTISLV